MKTESIDVKMLEELSNAVTALKAFAGDLKIWAFYGEMGAGKTTFIRSICEKLGVKENVTSPTFSIINEYNDSQGNDIFHFDFYRIKTVSEAVDIGCEEYFESGALCLIEWPEKILNLLPHPLIRIDIEVIEQKRRITFSHG